MHIRVQSVVEDRFEQFLDESFDVGKGARDFGAVFGHWTLTDRAKRENVSRENVADENRTFDGLNPVTAKGVFEIVANEFFLAENDLLVEQLCHYFDRLSPREFILVQIVQQQFESIEDFVSIQLEIFGAVFEQMYEVLNDLGHFDELNLLTNVLLQILVTLIRCCVLFFVTAQVDEQELQQLRHHSEQFVVEIVIEFNIKLFVGRLSQCLNDVVDRLTDEFFDLAVVLRRTAADVHVSHEMDEQMRHLVHEFQGFAVLEHDFPFIFFPFLFLFFLFVSVLVTALFVGLSTVHLKLRILHMLA